MCDKTFTCNYVLVNSLGGGHNGQKKFKETRHILTYSVAMATVLVTPSVCPPIKTAAFLYS